MRLFLPREDWVSLSRALRGPMRKWWLRVGSWWLLALLIFNLALGTYSTWIYGPRVNSPLESLLQLFLDLLPNSGVGYCLPLVFWLVIAATVGRQIDGLAPTAPSPDFLLPVRYWHTLLHGLPLVLCQIVSTLVNVLYLEYRRLSVLAWVRQIPVSYPGPTEAQEAAWDGLTGCIPAFWCVVLLIAAWPQLCRHIALSSVCFALPLFWRALLISIGFLQYPQSTVANSLMTGGLIGFVEINELPRWGWLGLGIMVFTLATVRLRIWPLAWAGMLFFTWTLLIRISAGTPPYPIQATVPSVASSIHGAAYSSADVLLSLPWRIEFDGEVNPNVLVLSIPALNLGWSFQRDRLPWWFVLQVPFFVLMLCLPLALISSLPDGTRPSIARLPSSP